MSFTHVLTAFNQVEIRGRGTALVQLQNRFRSRPKTTLSPHQLIQRAPRSSQPYHDEAASDEYDEKTFAHGGEEFDGDGREVRNVESTNLSAGRGRNLEIYNYN